MFRKKRILSGRRILITGASSGIGRALALALASRTTKLLITARNADALNSNAAEIQNRGSEPHIVAGDITDAGLRDRLVVYAKEQLGGLDMVVNNAGIGGIGTFASADEARLRQIMEVNFFAAAELIRAALPLLRASDDGVVVNIGSVLGHCAVPQKSEYCASKFALHGLTDALRIELADEGIDVLLVSPSTTSSKFFANAMRSEGDATSSESSMTPAAVATEIVRAIETRRREAILSAGGRLLVLADRLAPDLISRLLRKFG